MTQALLFLAIHAVGLVITLAIGPRRHPALCCALAFPVGLAVVVVLALALLVAGIPYRAGPLAVAALIPMLVSAVVVARRGLDRRSLAIAAGWTASFAVVAAALTARNLSLMTFDSHRFVMLGQVIGADQALAPGVLAELQAWGVFQVIAQSTAAFTAEDYLYGLAPVLGASFVAVFALTSWHAAAALGVAPERDPERQLSGVGGATTRRARVVVGLVTAALATTYLFHHHLLYIHANLGAAVYLFGFVALFWLAEVNRDPSGLPVAFLCLLAFALHRIETPPFALVVLTLTVLQSELPRRAITPWLAVFILPIVVWYQLLSHHVPADSAFLTPTRCRIISHAVAAFFVYWMVSGHPRMRRLNRHLPLAMVAVSLLAVAAAFVAEPGHMWSSTRGWAGNLMTLPQWGQTWPALVVLAVLAALAAPPPPHARIFTVAIGAYVAYLLVLALGRSPYYVYVGDSANRMTLHILPLVFFYLALRLNHAQNSRSPASIPVVGR